MLAGRMKLLGGPDLARGCSLATIRLAHIFIWWVKNQISNTKFSIFKSMIT